MQLYTYTKRNREKVLYYYDSLVSARVRPTAHTYKVCVAPICIHWGQGVVAWAGTS